jgi:hypothetical protein
MTLGAYSMNRFTLLSLTLGAVLVDVGAALIYHPLGFIVAGAFLFVTGVLSIKGGKK